MMEEPTGKRRQKYEKAPMIDFDFDLFSVVEATTSAPAPTPAAASGPAYSYDDLFPALPESTTPKFSAPANNKMRIGSSVVTQVRILRRIPGISFN
jgi:hypothetical protein